MKLRSIQFLRAIAALLVTYIHSLYLQWSFTAPSRIAIQQRFFYWRDFGNFGVDLFFVISGFIITYSASKYSGGRQGLTFLKNRFIRLNPVYYIASILTVAVFAHSWQLHHDPYYNRDMLIKTIVILPIFHTYWVRAVLPTAWTLSYEWYFYLLFAITIICRTKRKDLLLLLLIATPVLIGLFLPRKEDYRLVFITNSILLEFLTGMLIYRCYSTVRLSKTVAWLLLTAGMGICLYEIISGNGLYGNLENITGDISSLLRFLWAGIPAGLLVSGCVFLEKEGTLSGVWNSRLMSRIGDASYSIYLTHFAVLGLCAAVYTRVGFFLDPDLAVFLQFLLAVAAGYIFYQKIEAPLLHRLRKPLFKNKKATVA